ncbi:hypothetical protein TNIN_444961 [Trichonephila inaurata madagascariensis]|uniref:Uncharacterized protein n=1 Tax=Trichonephila inaurata madagascariensis TaxID=2747483 RepID=A0A8X6MJ12_9ARAC|nr:hypothetical protein TNIN_444961 [Trichonephila inaurata madagascariensis]
MPDKTVSLFLGCVQDPKAIPSPCQSSAECLRVKNRIQQHCIILVSQRTANPSILLMKGASAGCQEGGIRLLELWSRRKKRFKEQKVVEVGSY